ncbi:MAG: chemotaxis protein CheW [Burkholderiaceae bacterium]|nr:chemotaxis protein CheW [Burkholderiaceae bacterium]
MNMSTPTASRGVPQTAHNAQAASEYLSFRLGSEEYGIDILRVQEIRGYDKPTRMANTPSFIKGVVNLRGVIVPIIDLRMKFGLSEVNYDGMTVTIVLNIGQRVIGVVVDSVSDVIALQGQDIKPAPEFSGALSTEHIIGLGTIKTGDEERMLILMDIEKLMSSADMGLIAETTH